MHVRNLAPNQLADQNVGTLANRLRSAEDLFPFRMAPPAAPDGTADNRLCEIWKRATSGLEDDSVTFNKRERFLVVHDTPTLLPPLPLVQLTRQDQLRLPRASVASRRPEADDP